MVISHGRPRTRYLDRLLASVCSTFIVQQIKQRSDRVFSDVYRAEFAFDMGRAICMHLDLTAGVTVTDISVPYIRVIRCLDSTLDCSNKAPLVHWHQSALANRWSIHWLPSSFIHVKSGIEKG